MTRVKKTLITGVDQDQATEAMHTFALSSSREKETLGKMEAQIVKIREKFKDQLENLKEAKEQSFNILHTYAGENQELFAKKKSLDMAHGKIGFRTGTPKLSKARGFSWKAVLELALEKVSASAYIKTKHDLDKEKLLLMRNEEGVSEVMKSIKVEVIQDETFYAEPKEESN